LELLAGFVANVGVVGMKLRKLIGVGVDVGEGEFEFTKGLDHLGYVEGPTSLFNLQFFQRTEPVV
jgi:hypothetical protein